MTKLVQCPICDEEYEVTDKIHSCYTIQKEQEKEISMRKFVKWFILGTLILWLIVDIWLASKGGPTISRVVVDATNDYAIPIVGISMYVLGHMTWPQKRKSTK